MAFDIAGERLDQVPGRGVPAEIERDIAVVVVIQPAELEDLVIVAAKIVFPGEAQQGGLAGQFHPDTGRDDVKIAFELEVFGA